MRLSKMIGAVLVSMMLHAAPAGAQPVDDQLRATARALADEGMSFFEKKQYADALDRFDRAAAIIQAPTITLHAARSLDKLGRLIEAAERYRACINTAVDDKSPEAFRAAQDAARTELQTLTPRIPSVEVAVQGPGADQAVVTLDGKPVPKALVGVKMLVNPGDHKIAASTESHADLEEVTVTEKQSARLVLELEPKKEGNGTTPPQTDKPASQPLTSKQRGGIIALAAGGALGIVGIATGAAALSKQGPLEERCPAGSTSCDFETQAEADAFTAKYDEYNALRIVSSVGLVLGGGAIIAGTVLLITGSKAKPASNQPATSFHIEPVIGPKSLGFRGTF
jgi:tetratricopeptide (TPR) repeat protein